MKKLFILDVSGYIFRAYFALPPMSSPEGESTNGLYGFIRSILKLFKEFGPEHIVAVFDGPDNKKQRVEIYEKYKANRVRLHEDLPEQIERAKEFCELIGIPHLEIPGVEADDTMGSIAVWAASEQGADVFLCTSDKDFAQLVNERILILNTWKENLIVDRAKVEELYGVPPEQIIDLLAIVGDSSDNIPGMRGFGPKTTIPLLKEFGSLDNLLAHPDKVKGAKKQETLRQEADIARMSRRLATIHTDVPFPKERRFFTKAQPDLPGLKAFYIRLGFNTLVKELDSVLHEIEPEEETAYHLVDDEESLEKLIALLEKREEISFDVETTSLRPLLAKLVGIGFSFKKGEGFYVPLNGRLGATRVLETLRPLFENPELSFYGHNAKYDLHLLANVGIRVHRLSFDTILASYLLHSAGRRHSLSALTLHYFGKVMTPIKDLIGSGKKEIGMDRVPIEKVSKYCCEDVDFTLRLKEILEKEIHKRKLDKLFYEVELPLTRVLAKMERAGIYLDREKLAAFSSELVEEIARAEQEVYRLAGEKFNISSPKQLAHILFEKMGIKPLKKTATGLSTRAEVLETLSEEHPIAEKILSFRSLEKLRSTYVDALPLEINPETGRIHPTFNQFIAATGRLACQDPNLQNIPVRTEQGRRIRRAFKPQKRGWSYLSADYSQVELRLLAHLSEDPELIKAFKHGEDIHAYTASLVFGVPLEEVSSWQRHQAKAINFGIIYGQQAYGLSQELRIDVRAAAEFIEAYFERYPRVFDFVDTCIKQTRKTGKSVTMIGREREIPEILSSNAVIRNQAERLAINTPLQGSAADLIKLAMLEIDHRLNAKEMEGYMILQIHDELIFEVPDHEIDELRSLVREAMEGVFSLKVPLIVDLAVGKNWAEC
ncbi:MAG: DNA polymerase I [Chlamydiales bacterium]|nr:DNA polymerase I [Chlamydiales bacterium]